MYALLTLDLRDKVPTRKREDFYEALDAAGWAKLDEVATAWTAEFSSDMSRVQALKETRHDVRMAAVKAGIPEVPAIVLVSKTPHEDVSV